MPFQEEDDVTTPEAVLVCDFCHGDIKSLQQGQFHWLEREGDDTVTTALSHRSCAYGPWQQALSMSLDWIADPSIALQRLAELSIRYQWTAPQMRRLILVTWAAVGMATPTNVTKARALHDAMRGLDPRSARQ